MPALIVQTNVPVDSVIISDALKALSQAVARVIGKPEAYVLVSVKGGVPLSFGGTEEPAAFGEMISIGGIGGAVNKNLSAAITDILKKKLNVPPHRVFIKFTDVKGSDFGWNGSTM
eukprot:TRINITY_DN977_c0_g1_i1.p2 TRINITY_DN977_c0_g1~~TRINITY_DN977_c0_g1_i1.p2  ORF type:complete len:116 (-),score=18.47 TRINITY_DN977_c0_g1_i1:374-721(-)